MFPSSPGRPATRREFMRCSSAALCGGLLVARAGEITDTAQKTALELAFAFVEPWTDPSLDMTVSWVCNSAALVEMEYRPAAGGAWRRVRSQRSRAFPVLPDWQIHTALLEDLAPDAVHEIRWPGVERVEKFKTAARAEVDVCFLSDYQNAEFGPGGRLAKFGGILSSGEPDLLVLVGDYVSDDGRMDEPSSRRWFDFLRAMSQFHRTRDGALVPTVALTGNHEGIDAARKTNALCNGDGTIGQIAEIFSWSYDPRHPRRHCNSAATLSIGTEFFLISLETDHTEPLTSQLAWFSAKLAENAGSHRHVVVAGHSPAFYGMGRFNFSPLSPGRRLRNLVWPAMAPHAEKIRFYITGHEHILAITEKLRMDYDPALPHEVNDTRWAVDPGRGVRQLGSGPWGGIVLDIDESRAGERSSIDGSAKMLAAMGSSEPGGGEVQVFGKGIANPAPDPSSVWVARFGAAGFSARAVGLHGLSFYEVGETL